MERTTIFRWNRDSEERPPPGLMRCGRRLEFPLTGTPDPAPERWQAAAQLGPDPARTNTPPGDTRRPSHGRRHCSCPGTSTRIRPLARRRPGNALGRTPWVEDPRTGRATPRQMAPRDRLSARTRVRPRRRPQGSTARGRRRSGPRESRPLSRRGRNPRQIERAHSTRRVRSPRRRGARRVPKRKSK